MARGEIDCHCWVEHMDGTVYDPYPEWRETMRAVFESIPTKYDHSTMERIWGTWWRERRVYEAFPREMRDAIWRILYTAHRTEMRRAEHDEAARVCNILYPEKYRCYLNAYSYHKQHPHETVLRIGSLGLRLLGDPSSNVVWLCGRKTSAEGTTSV